MKRRKTGKKVIALILAATMALTLSPAAGLDSYAKTDLAMDDFDEIISTYNIDDSIPTYKNYMAEYGTVSRPDRVIEIPAGGYVRYSSAPWKGRPRRARTSTSHPKPP